MVVIRKGARFERGAQAFRVEDQEYERQEEMKSVMDSMPEWVMDENTRGEWAFHDFLQAVASLVSSNYVQVTDEQVLDVLGRLRQLPPCDRYDALDLLSTIVINCHSRGMCAPVLDEISRAWYECVREEVCDVR